LFNGFGQRDHVLLAINTSNSQLIAAHHSGLVIVFVKHVVSDSITMLDKTHKGWRVAKNVLKPRNSLGLSLPVLDLVTISLGGIKDGLC
jgi:hypothetical protein